MNLKNIISERSIIPNSKYYMIPLTCSSRIGKSMVGGKNQNIFAPGAKGEGGGRD